MTDFKSIGILGGTLLMVPFQIADASEKTQRPNVIVILADDLGYGDIGCFGHPTIKTPNIDRLAQEGMKMTQFYSASGVSTASRSALLTGRYPVRTGMYGDKWSVLYWDAPEGLPVEERTFARILADEGYSTACIGKWHLGKDEPFLPVNFGFSYWYGVPFANNFRPLPLMETDDEGKVVVIEENTDQSQLTRRYTEHIESYIREHRDSPFLIYYASTFPHVPLFASENFAGKSRRGPYGDTIEELDWSVGRIMNVLDEEGLDENTLLVFTSDNGPWITMKQRGGSSGLLRGGKGSAWEGGFRVPAVFRYPTRIVPGSVSCSISSLMDLFNTIVNLCGGNIPDDRAIDGVDLSPLFDNPDLEVRRQMQFWCGSHLRALRCGKWKLVYEPYDDFYIEQGMDPAMKSPLLFNIETDPSEKFDLSRKYPSLLDKMLDIRDSCQTNTEVRASVCDMRPDPKNKTN